MNLDETNIQLYKELWTIKSSLDIYMIIGRYAQSINAKPGKALFAFIQQQSLVTAALGLRKVFERKSGNHKLCSVHGVYELAKKMKIKNINAASIFVRKYDVEPSKNWKTDVKQVFSKQRPLIGIHIKKIARLRNQRFAHLEQVDCRNCSLPSIEGFEHLLEFADDFHCFVNKAFWDVHSRHRRAYIRS